MTIKDIPFCHLIFVCIRYTGFHFSVSSSTMGTISLVMSLIINVIVSLTFFILVIFVVRFVPHIASCIRYLTRTHLAWILDCPYPRHNHLPLDRPMSVLCNIGLAVSQYTRDLGQVDCAVCLCDINEGEEIRELTCKHLFHRSCLDRWLDFRHASCPLCRDYLFSSEAKAKLVEISDGDIEESYIPFLAAFVHTGWFWR